jgi:hypothetical protein
VRAIQRTQFCAKNAKNDLNPTYLVKRNFCFETDGVYIELQSQAIFVDKNILKECLDNVGYVASECVGGDIEQVIVKNINS